MVGKVSLPLIRVGNPAHDHDKCLHLYFVYQVIAGNNAQEVCAVVSSSVCTHIRLLPAAESE